MAMHVDQPESRPIERVALDKKETRTGGTDKLPAPAQRGKTYISDEVVSVIARLAAERVDGINRIGESSFRSLFARMGRHHGIESEVGMKEAALDVDIVVEFGYPIREVAQELRRVVIETVEQMTGRVVVELNVNIIDVYVPKIEHSPRRQLE